MYIYKFNHKNNVPSQLSPRWLCGNSWTWVHDVWLSHSAWATAKFMQDLSIPCVVGDL